MRSFIFILIGLVVLAGIYTFLPSCKQDKGPIIIEPCFCDTSEYKDPNCPCDQDKTPPPCLCDTTSYLDINCLAIKILYHIHYAHATPLITLTHFVLVIGILFLIQDGAGAILPTIRILNAHAIRIQCLYCFYKAYTTNF
jgi:hypothetical protein